MWSMKINAPVFGRDTNTALSIKKCVFEIERKKKRKV
jgi:hypothetical protein